MVPLSCECSSSQSGVLLGNQGLGVLVSDFEWDYLSDFATNYCLHSHISFNLHIPDCFFAI